MIHKHLRRMAAIALASSLALLMPGSLLAGTGNQTNHDADQTRDRDLSREQFVRPLLRDLPLRDESFGGAGVLCQARHASSEQPFERRAAGRESEFDAAVSDGHGNAVGGVRPKP